MNVVVIASGGDQAAIGLMYSWQEHSAWRSRGYWAQ
jgi:hypothetical protein